MGPSNFVISDQRVVGGDGGGHNLDLISHLRDTSEGKRVLIGPIIGE